MSLRVRDLRFRYAPAGALVIDGVNLDLAAGECAAITGPNGSGKSTLVAILAGIIPAFVRGELSGAVTGPGAGERPAVVLQNPDAQILCDGVEEELSFFLSYSEGRATDATPREIAASAGIGDLRSRKVYQLSHGEKQRLVAACALWCGGDRLVLLDEPSAHLDDDGAARLSRLLAKRKAAGASLLLIGHDCARLEGLIDRWYVLSGGRLVASREHQNRPIPRARPRGLAAPPPLLCAVRGLGCRSGGGEELFSGFSADIRRGTIYGLTGPNGSGKSSLARILCGAEGCAEGSIRFDGRDADTAALRERVKMVGQNPFHQLLYKSVAANLDAARSGATRDPAFTREHGIRLLALEPLMRRDVGTLSFGEAQRVAFLCAALQAPELLIIDELFASLDGDGIAAFAEALFVLRGAGASALLISHLEPEIAGIADETFFMKARGHAARG